MAANKDKVKIHITDLERVFDSKDVVLRGVSLDVYDGEVLVVIGPSGCGKSTLLRCINRLVDKTKGTIVVDGQDLYDHKVDINKARENIGMVFQHFNLFNNKNVIDNLTLDPLDRKIASKEEIVARATKQLERVGLLDKAYAYPSQLSGGQKQRVAIARALTMNPDITIIC